MKDKAKFDMVIIIRRVNTVLEALLPLIVLIWLVILLYNLEVLLILWTLLIIFIWKIAYMTIEGLLISWFVIIYLSSNYVKKAYTNIIIFISEMLSSILMLTFIYIFIEYYLKVTIHTNPIYLALLWYTFFIWLLHTLYKENHEKVYTFLSIYISIIFYTVNIFLLSNNFNLSIYIYVFIFFLFTILITFKLTKKDFEKVRNSINNEAEWNIINNKLYEVCIDLIYFVKNIGDINFSGASFNILDLEFELEENKKNKKSPINLIIYIFVQLIKNHKYEEVTKFNLLKWKVFNTLLKDDEIRMYYVIMWWSYQEIWRLAVADVYFNNYLNSYSLSEEEIIAWTTEYASKLAFLVKELGKIGLSYKVDKKYFKKSDIKKMENELKKEES